MKRNFSLFLARRYLRPKRSPVSLITLICVLGVSLGVWIMLVVIAIMAGFSERTKEMLLKFEPHIFVENRLDPEGPPYPMTDWKSIATTLRAQPNIRAVQPIVEGMVLADANGRRLAQRMRAFPGDDPVVKAETKLKQGSLDLDKGDCAVISDQIANSLGLAPGDTITLYSQGHLDKVLEAFQEAERDPVSKDNGPKLASTLAKFDASVRDHKRDDGTIAVEEPVAKELAGLLATILDSNPRKPSEAARLENALSILNGTGELENGLVIYDKAPMKDIFENLDAIAKAPAETDKQAALDSIKELVLPKELVVTGIFEQPPTPTAPGIFVPLHIGQELYSLGDSVHTIALRTPDAYAAKPVAAAIQAVLPQGLTAFPWMERPDLKHYFYALANERRMMYFALFMIMIVAAFCIMVTMITITVEKAKEIGVMKALGARESQIVNVFLLQGTLVGAIGAACGLAMAALTLRFRDQIQAALGAIGMDPFPANAYGLDRIPALLAPGDMAVICGGAFVLCSLAALPPAWMVARLDPAKALRKE